MAELNYAEFYAQAIEAAGGPASVVLPTNRYKVEIVMVKPGNATSGKFQVGIRFKILEGEYAGQSTWINQTLTTENPKAVGVFLKYMLQLGVPQEAISQGQPPDKLPDYIVVGTQGIADLKGDRVWDGKARQDLGHFQVTAVPQVTTSGVAINTGPVAAAPVAPAPVPVAAPVTFPVAPAPTPVPVMVATAATAAPIPVPQVAVAPVPVAAPAAPVEAPVAPAAAPVAAAPQGAPVPF